MADEAVLNIVHKKIPLYKFMFRIHSIINYAVYAVAIQIFLYLIIVVHHRFGPEFSLLSQLFYYDEKAVFRSHSVDIADLAD